MLANRLALLLLVSPHGQRIRVRYSEQRADGRVVHVDIEPSVVTIIPFFYVG